MGANGVNQHTAGDSVTTSTNERGATYAIRRLLKEGRTDLVEQVRAGTLSPHAAAVQAGFRKATWQAPVDVDDLEQALRKRYPSWFVQQFPGP